MNCQQLLQTILKDAYTKNDALRRLRILREYLEYVFFSTTKETTLQEYLKKQPLSQSDRQTMTAWNKSVYSFISQDNLYQVINTISSEIQKIPTTTLYLAAKLSEEETEKLGAWFRKNISPCLLLDIRLDEDKVVGFSIAKKGILMDYSLHYFIQKNKQAILNLVETYANEKKTAKK